MATVPLSPGRSKRFCELAIFFKAINHFSERETSRTKTPDLETDEGKSPNDAFYCFVNKLAQLCDSEKHGPTVTAFAVLQPGTIEYRFASNRRNRKALEDTQSYITNVLQILKDASDDELRTTTSVFDKLLDKVLAFNRSRLGVYITTIATELDFCIRTCGSDGPGEEASQHLQALQQGVRWAGNTLKTIALVNGNDFVRHTRDLLQILDDIYHSSFEEFIRAKARADSPVFSTQTPWTELRHALGRLKSYPIAVKVLISTRKRRPELFDDFDVTFVASSEPGSLPSGVRRTARGMASRMSGDKAITENIYRLIEKYQEDELDSKIKSMANTKNFDPVVHAEINLCNAILRQEQQTGERVRFFGETEFGQYIGCSKPTCMLCDEYFKFHPEGFKVRPSHGNFYQNWRMPHLYRDEGSEAERQRDKIVDRIMESLKATIFRVVRSGVGTGKKHDSNTSPTSYLGGTDIASSLVPRSAVEDDLVSRMGQASLGSVRGDGD